MLRCFSQPGAAEPKGRDRYNSAKSKSEHTASPNIIKLTRQELMDVATLSDLIGLIPGGCTIASCLLSIKGPAGATEVPNTGNALLPATKSRFPECQWILVENLKSSCPKAHKANYKLIIY